MLRTGTRVHSAAFNNTDGECAPACAVHTAVKIMGGTAMGVGVIERKSCQLKEGGNNIFVDSWPQQFKDFCIT